MGGRHGNSAGIDWRRTQPLNAADEIAGKYILYWMQASQREEYNHALEYAVGRANALGLPLLACFALTDDYPEANARHYAFMLQGLAETSAALARRGIQLVVRRGRPADVVTEMAQNAALLVTDRGYTRPQVAWRRAVAKSVNCHMVQILSLIHI